MTAISQRKAGTAGGGLAWLALALALGATLRFWNLSAASLSTDEAFTFVVSALSPAGIVATLTSHDFHPPLFYLATHYLQSWLHWPSWDYRSLTAAFGLVTIAATWGAARRMFGVGAASAAALIVALQPLLVQHDRLYRMYAVTVGLSTLSWWLLLEAGHATGRRRVALWIAYALVAIALPWVDYLGALMLLCQAIYALTKLPGLLPGLAGVALAAVAFVPWLGALRAQLPLGGLTLSKPALDSGLAASFQGAFAAGVPDAWLASAQAKALPTLVVAVILAAGMWLGRRSALPFWLAALILQIAGSIAFAKNLAYFPRYLLIDIPAIAIAAGLIVSLLAASRARLLAGGIALVLVGYLGLTTSNVLLDPYYQMPDWYAVNALILRNEQPGDAIVLDAGYELLVVNKYTAFAHHTIVSFMNPNDFGLVLAWIARHPNQRIWYVEHQHYYWDPQRRIAAALGSNRRAVLAKEWPRQFPVDRVGVVLYGKAPMTKM